MLTAKFGNIISALSYSCINAITLGQWQLHLKDYSAKTGIGPPPYETLVEDNLNTFSGNASILKEVVKGFDKALPQGVFLCKLGR
jgi:hypothetical protein